MNENHGSFNSPRVVAVIPAYNEAETIFHVVRAVLSASLVFEVIVVSDGSTDNTAELAKKAGARVIENMPNKGKGEALAQGVAVSDATHLFFCDADLIGLTAEHVDNLIRPVLSDVCGMHIGLRDRGVFSNAVTRVLPYVSGERVLSREMFDFLSSDLTHGYMVEVSLNRVAKIKSIPVRASFMSGVTIRKKIDKVGVLQGGLGYFRMWSQVSRAYFLSFVRLRPSKIYEKSRM